MVEKSEVSAHEVRIYKLMSADAERWFTNKQIAAEAQVARRTASQHTRRFVLLGLADQAEVFPEHRYRWSQMAPKRNKSYVTRLVGAAEALAA